jgi:O-antigen/teichoic acid export membrane protein
MGKLSADRSPSGASPPIDPPRPSSSGVLTTAAANLLLRTVSSLSSVALLFLVARRSNERTVGQLALLITVMAVGAVLARFGTDVTLAAAGGRSAQHADRGEFVRAIDGAQRTVASASVRTALLLAAAAIPLTSVVIGGEPTPVFLASLAVVPMAWAGMCGGALRGAGDPLRGSLIDGAIGPLGTFSLVVLLFPEPTPMQILFAWLVAWTTAAAIGQLSVQRVVRRIPDGFGTTATIDNDNGAGRQIVVIGLLNLVLASMDLVMLGMFETDEMVGHYAVAARVVVASTLVLTAVNQVLHPRLAAAYADRTDTLSNLVRQVTVAMVVIATLIVGTLLAARGPVLQLFGPNYEAAAPALVILAVGQFVVLATGPAGAVLLMTGHEHKQRQATMVAAAVNLLGNALLVPAFGMVGAATATAIALTAKNALSARWAWETMRT